MVSYSLSASARSRFNPGLACSGCADAYRALERAIHIGACPVFVAPVHVNAVASGCRHIKHVRKQWSKVCPSHTDREATARTGGKTRLAAPIDDSGKVRAAAARISGTCWPMCEVPSGHCLVGMVHGPVHRTPDVRFLGDT